MSLVKQILKRLFLILVLGILIAWLVRSRYPEVWAKTGKPLEQLPLVAQVMNLGAQQAQVVGNVLGDKIENVNDQIQTEGLPASSMINNALNNSEISQEIKAQVEAIVNRKTQELQQLPQAAMDEVKKEVRKEVRKQMCEEWLKE
ncbi:hypothetical protein A2160_03370 [Candidatus Beckwithbacteria bacterium RBG_13_42_9]|uniref:Uncharacterized protein n=1 Tax=Candidatus Beckwithbacteria bacterium RBG_13_42_9 TaxID=1797457 RepID=A0A1F5E8L0_9BACT|nr:MAG: hypothetical protein A2160_03370 [Candidatus Beckwithbacteria bacterium RBG_13_42_9]